MEEMKSDVEYWNEYKSERGRPRHAGEMIQRKQWKQGTWLKKTVTDGQRGETETAVKYVWQFKQVLLNSFISHLWMDDNDTYFDRCEKNQISKFRRLNDSTENNVC
jgi:hypothetical protein